MLRPAYLFSTAVLAAVASIQLQGMTPAVDHSPAVSKQPHTVTVPRPSTSAQTISNTVSKPTQPQRWVF